ncbi:hypothetical protein ACU4GI_33185 [Cupriavidus basilensis]
MNEEEAIAVVRGIARDLSRRTGDTGSGKDATPALVGLPAPSPTMRPLDPPAPAPVLSVVSAPVIVPAAAAPAPAPAMPVPARLQESVVLGLTVVREGDSLLLSFAQTPAKLFISDGQSGANVRDVKWLSDAALRVAVGSMREVKIKTPDGTFSVAISADGLSRLDEQKAPA